MANEHMKNTLKIKYTKMRCHYSLIKISEIDKNQTPAFTSSQGHRLARRACLRHTSSPQVLARFARVLVVSW